MCQKCKALKAEIKHARGFLGYGLDRLSSERIGKLIKEKEMKLATMGCYLKPS